MGHRQLNNKIILRYSAVYLLFKTFYQQKASSLHGYFPVHLLITGKYEM
jgi:hypothetical protein